MQAREDKQRESIKIVKSITRDFRGSYSPKFFNSIDHEKNKFNLLIIQPNTVANKTEYKTIIMQTDLKQVNAIDVNKWHR